MSSDLPTLIEQIQAFQLQVGPLTFGASELLLLAIAIALAPWSLLQLQGLFNREEREARYKAFKVVAPPEESDAAALLQDQEVELTWWQRLGATIASSSLIGSVEQSKMQATLASAGIKGYRWLATFVALKVVGLVAGPILMWLFLEWRGMLVDFITGRVALVLVALLLGWRLPDIVVSRLATQRRGRLELGIPDALDLLVICAEAGLGMEQAIAQIGIDLRPSSPDVADEFAATAAEMRVSPDRRAALENLAKRTGLATLRSMVSTLNQSVKYGTPLAQAMRILAAEMRQARVSRFEERAARLPVLLTFPLIVFIMPCLFMLLAGPMAIQLIDRLK